MLDDTFNSNPAGARLALAALAGQRRPGVAWSSHPAWSSSAACKTRRTRASPGAARAVATDVVVVGETNRRALLEGLRGSERAAVSSSTVRSRDEAVAWVRRELGPGDVVLYENDLPDHYP